MKNQYLFIIFLLFIVNNIQGQQIDISGLYSSSTAKQLKNNWGYGLRYNHFIKNNKIGLSFKHYFYNTEYDDIRSSTEDGISKYIEEYKPQNSRITVNLIYSYILVDNEKSNLYLGYNVGLNYYHFKGEKTRIENGFVKGGQYTYDYTV